MAGLRLVLDINVEAGNKSQANTTLSGLVEWKKTAEQFDSQAVWLRVCQSITTAFTGIDWLAPPQNVKFIPAGIG